MEEHNSVPADDIRIHPQLGKLDGCVGILDKPLLQVTLKDEVLPGLVKLYCWQLPLFIGGDTFRSLIVFFWPFIIEMKHVYAELDPPEQNAGPIQAVLRVTVCHADALYVFLQESILSCLEVYLVIPANFKMFQNQNICSEH